MTVTILSPDQITVASNALSRGEVVGMPTETVYGLAANAFDVNAVTRIFSAKERPLFDPLIVHVPLAWKTVERLEAEKVIDTSRMSLAARRIAGLLLPVFWPGPLTIIFPKSRFIPDLVTSGLDSVGVRMPSHVVAQALLAECGIPLAAPSANRFGRISPTSAADVAAELGDKINWIIDGGSSDIGIESTVVALTETGVTLLRPGKICSDDLSKVLDPHGYWVEQAFGILDLQPDSPKVSPGQLASHYAPRKPLFLIDTSSVGDFTSGNNFTMGQKLALLALTPRSSDEIELQLPAESLAVKRALTQTGQPEDAAKNLFSFLRFLDESPADILMAERPVSNVGLWHAVNDRLMRASAKTKL